MPRGRPRKNPDAPSKPKVALPGKPAILLDPAPTEALSVDPDPNVQDGVIVRYPGADVYLARRDLARFVEADQQYGVDWNRRVNRSAGNLRVPLFVNNGE